MKGTVKKYWCIKLIIIAQFILCLCSNQARAQHGFFLRIEDECCGYAQDIFEDEKGGILAIYDLNLHRISSTGKILWHYENSIVSKGIILKDSQQIIIAQNASEMGGFSMHSMDYRGNVIWEVEEDISSRVVRSINDFIIDSARKQYVVAGHRWKIGNYNSIQFWIAGVDWRGKILWEKYWQDIGENRSFTQIFRNNVTGGYILLTQDESVRNRKELINVDSLGLILNRNQMGPVNCEYNSDFELYKFKEGYFSIIYVKGGCLDIEDGPYQYFYNGNGETIEKRKIDFSIPFVSMILSNNNFIGLALSGLKDENVDVVKFDNNFNVKWRKTIYSHDQTLGIVFPKKIIQSRDGGYIGIAGGNPSNGVYVEYIFKTDSLGNIDNFDNKEKNKPIILQPNPAQNSVRLAVPNYYGIIKADFYDVQGRLIFQSSQSELQNLDISFLASGVYIVHAHLTETGEERKMRLVVE